MPLPTPKAKENKKEFIFRCMKFINGEKWKDQKQQLAICYSQLKNESTLDKLRFFLL